MGTSICLYSERLHCIHTCISRSNMYIHMCTNTAATLYRAFVSKPHPKEEAFSGPGCYLTLVYTLSVTYCWHCQVLLCGDHFHVAHHQGGAGWGMMHCVALLISTPLGRPVMHTTLHHLEVIMRSHWLSVKCANDKGIKDKASLYWECFGERMMDCNRCVSDGCIYHKLLHVETISFNKELQYCNYH